MRYRTIVADPPWPIGDFPQWFAGGKSGVIPRPYDVMTIDEIRRIPVAELADDTAHLYLWTITDWLEQSFGVARAWGFEPSAVLTWCKPDQPGGLGGTFPANTEFVLFCTRRIGGDRVLALTSQLHKRAQELRVSRRDVDAHMGTSDMGGWWLSNIPHRCACPTDEQWVRLKAFLQIDDSLDEIVRDINASKGEPTAQARAASRWFTWPRGAHSAKPEAFLDLVEQVSPGPRLEMFARRNRIGWDTWGNEALNHVEMPA